MDYRKTMHIEFQGDTYLAAQDIQRQMSDAIQVVLEHSAMADGLDRDAYMGDRQVTKGWASDAPANEKGVTRLAEQERLNGLLDDFIVKHSMPFERWGKALPWNDDTICPADREYKRLVDEDDVADEETLLAEAQRAREFALRGGDLG